MQYKLLIEDNDIKIINNTRVKKTENKDIDVPKKIVNYSVIELFYKALANIDYLYNTTFHLLYNPHILLFSTSKLQYKNSDVSVYTDNQEVIYKKFENISKLLCANIILQLYKYFYSCLQYDHIYIPSDYFGSEFDILFDLGYTPIKEGKYVLQTANNYIYTVAILKLFEEGIKNRNKRKEYKDTIKKVLEVFVEEKQIGDVQDWHEVANQYVKEEYVLPINKLYWLLMFHGR